MIKLIAFDLGDVLARDTYKQLGKKFKKNISASSLRLYVKAMEDINTGKTTEHEFVTALHNNVLPNMSVAAIHRALNKTKLLPPWSLAHKLKEHYRVAIWTNNHKTGPASFSRILHTPFGEFPIVNSAYIGVRKPHPAFFRKALQKFKLKPSEVLFIDDRPDNILAARKMGIRSFRYQGPMRPLKQFLKKHGLSGL